MKFDDDDGVKMGVRWTAITLTTWLLFHDKSKSGVGMVLKCPSDMPLFYLGYASIERRNVLRQC
jgi:hypothetical protein